MLSNDKRHALAAGVSFVVAAESQPYIHQGNGGRRSDSVVLKANRNVYSL
jgi:hypothetical protein